MYNDYYWPNPTETNALRSYKNDDWHESDDEIMDMRDIWDGPSYRKRKNARADNNSLVSDEQFEGGYDDGRNNYKAKQGFCSRLTNCFKSSGQKSNNDGDAAQDFNQLTDEKKKERIQQLWNKARRYNNKLRFQARLQKMAESNLKEMMIDDINEEADEEIQSIENQPKLKWYLIDTERTFCKVWNFIITLLTIYSLFVVPYMLVFQDVYEPCMCTFTKSKDGKTEEVGQAKLCLGDTKDKNKNPNWTTKEKTEYSQCTSTVNPTLQKIEMVIDIIYLVEIILNMLKKTRAHKEIESIAQNYVMGYFWFDVAGTIPELVMGQTFKFYWLKAFRMVHVYRLTQPLQLLLGCALQKYSKKRQNDLTSFSGLIFYVIYTCHVMACVWLKLGMLDKCESADANASDGTATDGGCTKSWVFKQGFDGKPFHTQYIFAFYWIFEVITTVGYGDYAGSTPKEYIFSIALEFMGLTFFSFLMGSINGIFNTSDNFDDLIEEKLDSLDMWIKKIEKSNKPFHIQPTLYNDIRKYVEQAFLYDFNLVIEEFQFYQQITPKMQTDLIQNTRVFKEFEKSFNHFFEECERGFTNELIISMYCRIYTPGKVVISYKSNVKEMYFIRQGLVEVFNNENDEIVKEKPILYLPKYSYFGDYQILYNLKSNLVFKTLAHTPDNKAPGTPEQLPDIIFMCISKDVLCELCDLFPQTAENIKRRSLERRHRFMLQKNTNSRNKQDKKKDADSKNQNAASDDGASHQKIEDGAENEDVLEDFSSDEEPENFESQKEDMKMYLNKLNKRIDLLVDALKQADQMMAKMGDQKGIIEQINQKKAAKAKKGTGQPGPERKSIAEFFKEQINRK